MAEEFTYVSKFIPGVNSAAAREIVTGKTKFAADFYFPDTLWVKILRSPYAHATIMNIDTSKAENLPGVVQIATYENTPPIPYVDQRRLTDPRCLDSLIFNKEVRWAGEEVAAVLAESKEIAEEAIKLIDVEYNSLPAIFEWFETSPGPWRRLPKACRNRPGLKLYSRAAIAKKAG